MRREEYIRIAAFYLNENIFYACLNFLLNLICNLAIAHWELPLLSLGNRKIFCAKMYF